MYAVCDDGFKYLFYFQNDPVLKKYINQCVYVLHYWVLAIFDKLKHKYHHACMDSLYNYYKFSKYA